MIETISDRQLEIIEAAGKILTASGVSGKNSNTDQKPMQIKTTKTKPKKVKNKRRDKNTGLTYRVKKLS